ncbi:MAG: hypothetical protein ACE5OY_08500 [Candidatus Bathyarchaeia archaeon]
MSEREEAKARAELASAMREHLPSTMINLSAVALIWLFGALVFLPAAERIAPEVLPLACALILLIGFSTFVFKAFGGLRVLLGAASDVLAYRYVRWRKTETPVERLMVVVRCVVWVVAVLIVYALYWSFLVAIHPSLAGLVLIPIVLWVFLMLLRAITARS